MIFFILIIVLLCALGYVCVRNWTYWKRNYVPQHTVLQVLNNNLRMFTESISMAEVFDRYYKHFPNKRYFGIYQLFRKSLMVKDLELIEQITVKHFSHFQSRSFGKRFNEPLWDRNLIALEGQEWTIMRNAISHTFSQKKMKMMFELMLTCTKQLVSHFEEQLQNQSVVNVNMKDAYTRLIVDAISSVAFGYANNSLKVRNNDFYKNFQSIVPTAALLDNVKLFVIFGIPKLARLLDLKLFPERVSKFFLDVISKNIKEREKKGIVRYDLIDFFLKARKNSKLEFSNVDITAQSLLFFIAGVETTSALLSFMSCELALHPKIQKRLQEEVDETLQQCNGSPSYDTLKKMPYMDMVISESLRKWPTGVFTERMCTKPYVIQPVYPDEKPVFLKKGDNVWIPIYSIQRDPNLYPNPEEFDPERFNEENVSGIHPYGYMPFGAGPRICIGNRLALMEVKILFLDILSKFHIVTVGQTKVPLKLAKLYIQLSIEGGFWLGLRRRHT